MTYHPEFDPYRPMQHWLCSLLRAGLTPESDEAAVSAALPLSLTHIYQAFCQTQGQLSPGEDFLASLDYLQETDRAIPSKKQVDQAPQLEAWALAKRQSSLCILVGYVAGHPRFRWGTPIVTSALLTIDPERRWARSWNRYYLLGGYHAGPIERSLSSGLLPPDARLCTLD